LLLELRLRPREGARHLQIGVVVRVEQGVLLDQSVVDFEPKIPAELQLLHVGLQGQDKLGQLWLLGDAETLLDDVVAVLIC